MQRYLKLLSLCRVSIFIIYDTDIEVDIGIDLGPAFRVTAVEVVVRLSDALGIVIFLRHIFSGYD